MPRVTITLNGRDYQVNCEAGHEARVQELGAFVNERLKKIVAGTPGGSDAHLLMLTALVLADELFDLNSEIKHLRSGDAARALRPADPPPPPPPPPPAAPEADAKVVEAMSDIARRVEDIASRLEQT